MSNVWRSLHFDASLRVVTLVEFGDFASQRDRFSFLLWKLAPHLGGLNEIIRYLLQLLYRNLTNHYSIECEIRCIFTIAYLFLTAMYEMCKPEEQVFIYCPATVVKSFEFY